MRGAINYRDVEQMPLTDVQAGMELVECPGFDEITGGPDHSLYAVTITADPTWHAFGESSGFWHVATEDGPRYYSERPVRIYLPLGAEEAGQ
ncbi:hypothetical protein [Streptomyces sp. URMC 124]|uniref:hypothetical protein n=1 Tax=Streptomyces sp. URMC 124 TaxID=3423405 RepID=UPI003F1ADB08